MSKICSLGVEARGNSGAYVFGMLILAGIIGLGLPSVGA